MRTHFFFSSYISTTCGAFTVKLYDTVWFNSDASRHMNSSRSSALLM